MHGCLKIKFFFVIVLIMMGLSMELSAQSVYTARGFWEESNKTTYKQIKIKQVLGDPISDDELGYLNDFEVFLASYYEKMSPEERAIYEKMRYEWDREIIAPQKPIIQPEEFEWRGIDRAVNIG